jgi:SAM-dependent methyltransferase
MDAWDLASTKYAPEVVHDVAFLQAGGTSLLRPEQRLLGQLSPWCGRAIHLQCSHGLDTLSLWKLGAREVFGVDISAAMLSLARRKAELLHAPAVWVHSDVLELRSELNATADLVYTGKGALPWVFDLQLWSQVVSRLLRPDGRLYIFEGHPLNWVWEPEASEFRLRDDGGDYFWGEARANRDFPASAVARATAPSQVVPQAFERQWNLGAIVTSLVEAGLVLERLEEYPEHFWPQFSRIPEHITRRLPHTFSLLMRKRAA